MQAVDVGVDMPQMKDDNKDGRERDRSASTVGPVSISLHGIIISMILSSSSLFLWMAAMTIRESRCRRKLVVQVMRPPPPDYAAGNPMAQICILRFLLRFQPGIDFLSPSSPESGVKSIARQSLASSPVLSWS